MTDVMFHNISLNIINVTEDSTICVDSEIFANHLIFTTQAILREISEKCKCVHDFDVPETT